jgi:hypothetical protein
MRTNVRVIGLVAAIAAALATSACAPPAESPTPSASPSATPLFHSDEEALAAAKEAYAAYVEITDQIFSEGGVHLERLDLVATGNQLEADRAGLGEMASKGYRSVGRTTFDQVKLQRNSPLSLSEPEVVVYLCQDISAVDVVDVNNVSVVSDTRPDRISYEVSLDSSSAIQTRLLISDRVPWNQGTC